MYEIAIVEENEEDAEHLHSVLEAYATLRGMQFDCARFRSPYEFLAEREQFFHIVFLDASPASGGMDAARKFRLLNSESAIVFVTRDLLQAVRSYEVDALDYIIKPVTLDRLSLRLARAFAQKSQGKTVVIRDRTGSVQILAESVYYIEIHGHALTWHTEQGNFTESGSMKQLKETLGPYGFAPCNACYLINLRHAHRVKGYFLTMSCGDVLKISQPKRKEFLAALRRG